MIQLKKNHIRFSIFTYYVALLIRYTIYYITELYDLARHKFRIQICFILPLRVGSYIIL